MVLALPENLQEPAFMLVQYLYALGTMLPCPLWFWYRWPSAAFLMAVFVWSIYNGATYYIDVFGKRFQNELEQLKKDVAKWQASPDIVTSPEITPKTPSEDVSTPRLVRAVVDGAADGDEDKRRTSIDRIPMLDPLKSEGSATTLEESGLDLIRHRSLPQNVP